MAMSMSTPLRLTGRNTDDSAMPPVPARSPARPVRRMRYSGNCLEAQSLDYYYGKINNELVEELLRPWMDVRGAFLLRDSNTEPDVITISVVDSPHHIYNFKVSCKSLGLFKVTEDLKFRSLRDLTEFFFLNDIPGQDISNLKLLTPVRSQTFPRPPPPTPGRNFARSPPKSPPTSMREVQSPTPSVPPRSRMSPPANYHPHHQVSGNTRRNEPSSSFIDSRLPAPIPTTEKEPIYVLNDHVYSRAEDLQKSKISEIMELCKLSDRKYKKCSCGLYLEESMLVGDWMMHLDRPTGRESGTGRVFFVNTVSNQTLWTLPNNIMSLLHEDFPEKFTFVQKLLREGHTL